MLHRPESPHLPHETRLVALQPSFEGLVAYRDSLTSDGSSSFVLSFYGLPPSRNPSDLPGSAATDFAAASSPIRPCLQRILGFAPARGLTQHERLTALHFRSTRPRTYDSTRQPLAGCFRPLVSGLPLAPVLRGMPLSLRYRVPCDGPRVWTFTSCLLCLPGARASPARLRRLSQPRFAFRAGAPNPNSGSYPNVCTQGYL